MKRINKKALEFLNMTPKASSEYLQHVAVVVVVVVVFKSANGLKLKMPLSVFLCHEDSFNHGDYY